MLQIMGHKDYDYIACMLNQSLKNQILGKKFQFRILQSYTLLWIRVLNASFSLSPQDERQIDQS